MHIKNKSLLQISFTTNIFEIYEWLISGYLAIVIGQLFFTPHSNIIAVILSFGMFAASFLIQPIGGFFWGHIGDKYGSGIATKYSMLIMAIPTCIITFLPTYINIGVSATFLLLLLKLIQGFGAGGQVATNFCYVYEKATETKHVSWFCGLAACGGWVGSLLASLVAYLLYAHFSDKTINAWAWRLPFLITIPMFFFIYRFRKNIAMENNLKKNVHSVSDYFSLEFFSPFIKAFVLLSFMQVSFYMLFVWLPTYLDTFLGVSDSKAMLSNVIVLVAAIISVASWGYLGKFFHYKRVILSSVILLIIFTYPLFSSLTHASFIKLVLIQLAFVLLYTPIEGSYVLAIGHAFKEKVRNRGFAMAWNLSIALCGGTTPIICTYFIHALNSHLFPIFYLLSFGIITIPAVLLL